MPNNQQRELYLSELNTYLKESVQYPELYTPDQSETFRKYLDLGACADYVLNGAIQHQCLLLVKLACEYPIISDNTKLIEMSLIDGTVEITHFLIARNNEIDLFSWSLISKCIASQINLLEAFGSTLAALNNTTRADLVAFYLRKFDRTHIFPLVEACIQLGINNTISTNEDSPFYYAMIKHYPDIVTALLHDSSANILHALTHRNEFLEQADQETISAYIEALSRILSNYPELTPEELETAETDFQDALAFALELSAETHDNAKQIERYLTLGAIPNTETLCLFIENYGIAFFSNVLRQQAKPELTPLILTRAIKAGHDNIHDIFSDFIETTPGATLTRLVAMLFDFFIPTTTDFNTPFFQKQIFPFMSKCFQHGANVNVVFTGISSINQLQWIKEVVKICYTNYNAGINSISFLQAAMILNCQPLIRLFLEAGANIAVNIPIQPAYKSDVNCKLFTTVRTSHLGNALSQQTYFSTIPDIIKRQNLRLTLFNLLQSVLQPKSNFHHFPTEFILDLAAYLIPDNTERELSISQYKRHLHNSRHYFFTIGEINTNAVNEPSTTLVVRKST